MNPLEKLTKYGFLSLNDREAKAVNAALNLKEEAQERRLREKGR